MNLDYLNDKQKEAVLSKDGPLLILAGAGSGKTQTMTYRIANLIENGVSPFSILAVTFTNKAAKEMRERVVKLTGDIPGMWIMTFHQMSLRILRFNYEKTGYSRNFLVYDTVDTEQVLKEIIKEKNLDTKMYPIKYLRSIISTKKEEGISAEYFYELNCSDKHGKIIAEIYLEYMARLKKNDAMDFDDLLLNCYKLLSNNEDILYKYQEKFKYIMVDEYQDTNMLQYNIIKLLQERNRNICVVGDDDQCIYEWRGADIRNILGFEKDFPDAKVIKLEQNYRSSKYILDAAYSVIKNNKKRKEKRLWTDKKEGEKVLYHKLDDGREEAYYISHYIKTNSKNKSFDDFAVLYRLNSQSRLIEDALNRERIPYQVLSGISFYKRKETKDIISYLRLVYNPNDSVALKRVINEPKRGIGNTTIEKIEALAKVKNISLFDCITDDEFLDGVSAKVRENLKKFTDIILELKTEEENLDLALIFDNLITKTGYMSSLESSDKEEDFSKKDNLLSFRSYIVDFMDDKEKLGEKATLSEFLENVSISSEQDGYDSDSGKVTLMTIHSAKGLEFPIVFMPGMENGIFPNDNKLFDKDELEEERRLCYVGMTRAKEKLILLSAYARSLYGNTEYQTESIFLKELDKRTLDTYGDSIYVGKETKIESSSLDGFSKTPYVPFKNTLEEINSVNQDKDFKIGDEVSHKRFGHGIVTDITDSIIEVKFDEEGIKKLGKKVAPLKRV